jgi:hypothetical protein
MRTAGAGESDIATVLASLLAAKGSEGDRDE